MLKRLQLVLEQRKQADPEVSYVAGLYEAGLNKILEKIGEEAVETILAAKDAQGSKQGSREKTDVVRETADLWFHSLVMLSHLNIDGSELLAELENRFGTSGLAEKASRGT